MKTEKEIEKIIPDADSVGVLLRWSMSEPAAAGAAIASVRVMVMYRREDLCGKTLAEIEEKAWADAKRMLPAFTEK